MKYFITTLLLFCIQLSSAQPALHVMFSRGTLPAWVNTSPAANLQATVAEKARMGWKIDQNSRSALAQANEAQYNYLQGGRLLFNDEAGALANKIADRLLENDAALRRSLNICVYYSSGTNLVSFPNGFIVVELGLFAQLENEDQLAFLLAHEIAHVKNGDLATSEEAWQPDRWSPQVEKYLVHLRERERQADLDAYQLYKIAGYSRLQALRVFEVLERNWSVPEAHPFSTHLFTDSLFSYGEYFAALTDSCSLGLGESDFFNTAHESYAVRRSHLAKEYSLDTTTSQLLPMTPEFAAVNQLAIYNCGIISLENQDFAAALYMGCYLYETDSAQRDAAGLLMSKAIYLYAATASSETEFTQTSKTETIKRPEKFGDLFFWANNEEPEKDRRGYIAGVAAFYSELTYIERMILSVRWCWEYSQATSAHRPLAEELAANSVSILNYLVQQPADSLTNIPLNSTHRKRSSDEDEEEKNETISSRDKKEMKELLDYFNQDMDALIDSLKKTVKKPSGPKPSRARHVTEPGYITQLASCVSDSSFRSFYNLHMSGDSIQDLREKPRPHHLQADSIYFASSNHVWCREYKRTYRFKVNEEKTENKSLLIRNNIHVAGKTAKIKLLSASPLEPDTVTLDDYNNYSLARRVFSEAVGYGDEKYTYPIAYKEEFDSLVQKTHVTHMITDLAVTKQFTKIRQPVFFAVGVIFPYTAPIALLWVAPPRKFTYRQTSVYNLQTGNLDWVWVDTGKGSGGPQKANPYYAKVFRKIKKPKTKPTPATPVR